MEFQSEESKGLKEYENIPVVYRPVGMDIIDPMVISGRPIVELSKVRITKRLERLLFLLRIKMETNSLFGNNLCGGRNGIAKSC